MSLSFDYSTTLDINIDADDLDAQLCDSEREALLQEFGTSFVTDWLLENADESDIDRLQEFAEHAAGDSPAPDPEPKPRSVPSDLDALVDALLATPRESLAALDDERLEQLSELKALI